MNKITKIFNNIGFYCSINQNIIVPNKAIAGYKLLEQDSIGYFIPYLIRNIKDGYKWEIGVGEVQFIDGLLSIKKIEISSSSNNNNSVIFTGNENEFYLFVNNTNFNTSFNNVILKNDHFTIDNVTSIYLVDNNDKNIDCVLPQSKNARNLVIDIKPISSAHNVIIRNHNGSIFESTKNSIRLVCDGQTWYILNENDHYDYASLSNPSFSAQSNPGGAAYSFQYNDGSNGLLGSEAYWSSGDTNKLLLGSSSESLAHTVIPTSGSADTIFNQDYQASDFIIYGSGQPYRNLFFSYDGRVGINIPSGSRPQTIFHVVNYSCSEILRLENRTSCQPAKLTIYHKPSSSLSDNTVCSILNLAGKDSNNIQTDYALIRGLASSPTNRHGGLVLSIASGNNQQNIVSGDLSNINIGYDNSKQLNISNNGNVALSGSNISALGLSSVTIGTNNANIVCNNNSITTNFNTLFLGSGSITSNGILSASNISASTITLPNIAASSILALSNNKTIVPINGISVNSGNNGLIFNNISGNKFLTTDSNNNVVGVYDTDDYFLTEKDIVWNKYQRRSCTICLKQVIFDDSIPSEEFSIGDQVEIINGNNTIYRTITDMVMDQNSISELILNQNVTSNSVDSLSVFSISKGGYLTIQKSTTDIDSDSTSIRLSIRPNFETIFNTAQKNIDFSIYGTDTIPAFKVYANVGSKTQISGTYYNYATENNTIASIPVNIGGSGINNNFSSANFKYNSSNNVFSGIVSSVGTNGISSHYGTYDQNGNVAEWLEPDPIDSNNSIQYAAGGSTETHDAIYLKSIEPAVITSGYNHIGFRIASVSNITDSSPIGSILNFSFQTINDAYNIADTDSLYLRSSEESYDTENIFNLGYVDRNYRISTYETTNAQYARYLNAVATGINYTSSGLYDTRMDTEDSGGILRNTNGSSYSYTTKLNMANKPVNFISYINAIKFVNWLHNGTPSGIDFADKLIDEILDDGAYSLLRENNSYLITHNSNKKYFLPNIHQWHKAAYFQPVPAVLVSGKPVVTINTDTPYIVATEKITTTQSQNTNSTVVPKQLLADLTVSGWLVVDKLIVRDGTIASSLSDIGFEPEVPTEETISGQTIVDGDPPPQQNETGGSNSNVYWSNSTASVRKDGVYGETEPPYPPNGNGESLDCEDPLLIETNNIPYWCRPSGIFIGPYFY